MRSRAIRLTASTAVWLTLAAAALFIVQSQRHIASRESGVRTFEQRAQEVSDALARMRAAQQAYVAEGQGQAFWIAKVGTLAAASSTGVDALYAMAVGVETLPLLDSARSHLTAFADIDARIRGYLRSHQELMAADVVFTEGSETIGSAAGDVQAAARAERDAFATFEDGRRRLQAIAAGGAGLLAVLVMSVFALARPAAVRDVEQPDVPSTAVPETLRLRKAPEAPGGPSWTAAAEICTTLSRISDVDAAAAALAHAAEALDARGLIVWVGDPAGADLQPVLAHGYSAQALARMPSIPRSADNAAAAAYRTGTPQVVTAGPDGSTGALVSPILTPGGCVGALTAEVPGGAEQLESGRALVALLAAQVSSIVAPTAAARARTATTATA